MKKKLQADFIPKWKLSMPKKHHKSEDKWVAWQQPSPTKDVQTSHQRVFQQKTKRDNARELEHNLLVKFKAEHPEEKHSYKEWLQLMYAEIEVIAKK